MGVQSSLFSFSVQPTGLLAVVAYEQPGKERASCFTIALGDLKRNGENRDSQQIRCAKIRVQNAQGTVFRPYLNVAVIARNRNRPICYAEDQKAESIKFPVRDPSNPSTSFSSTGTVRHRCIVRWVA